MPKDKTQTHVKIVESMREEFLRFGYDKASLNRVSAKVGITTAGLSRHFSSKQDMFAFLVRDTLDDFRRLTEDSSSEMSQTIGYRPFDVDWTGFWVDFIYDHLEGMKLLICCSKGSAYESFEEDVVLMEAEENKRYAEMLRRSGRTVRQVSDAQWHMLSTAYVHLLFETVRHDMTKAEALEHARFVGDLLYPGWKKVLGQ